MTRLSEQEQPFYMVGAVIKRTLSRVTLLWVMAGCGLHEVAAADATWQCLRADSPPVRPCCHQHDVGGLQTQTGASPSDAGKARTTPKQSESPALAEQARARELLEHEVEEVRGLKFLRPLTYRSMKTAEFRHFLVKKIREEYTPQEMRDYSRTLAMIGLVPEGVDFEACVMQVMDEQVAAFYDQDKGDLYTFADSPLTGNLNRMVLAHEMTHALQDQHFHIKQWPLKRKDNDDLVTAHLAVLEGDATVRMQVIYRRGVRWKTVLSDVGTALAQDTRKLATAPRYFRDMLMFPYQEGAAFIEELQYAGGRALVNRSFESPPSSTAQILHPEKYYHPNRQEPVLAEPQVTPSPGWRRLVANNVGEFGVIVLLRQFGYETNAATIAEGWRGDRYMAFETAEGEGRLFWRSVWGSETGAKRFADAYADVVTKRNIQRRLPLMLGLKRDGRCVDVEIRAPRMINRTELVPTQKQ